MTRRAAGPASEELHNAMGALREAAGLTQQALADAARVTRKTINTIERGHYVPSTVLALRIARALGVTVEDVFWLPEDGDRNHEASPSPRTADAA
jgi:putative transcriptional regulator